MGQRFLRESSYAKHLKENPERLAMLGAQLIEKDGLILTERDQVITGMLGSILHNHFMSGELMAGEVFWWVEPEYRGDGIRLVKETETRARAAGAVSLQMIAPNERVAALYQRMGYEFVESTWQKKL